jgi:hypothetical protein
VLQAATISDPVSSKAVNIVFAIDNLLKICCRMASHAGDAMENLLPANPFRRRK